MKIFIFRHGETNWNVEGRVKGQIESLKTTFTNEGNRQIEEMALFIENNLCEAIFSSDMVRAHETAKIVVEKLSLPLHILTNFRGLNVGTLQGILKQDFDSSDIVKRAFSDYDFAFPEGESVNQLIRRFIEGLNLIRDSYHYETVAIITHGASISNIKAYLSHDKFQSTDYCIIQSSEQDWDVIDAGLYKTLF